MRKILLLAGVIVGCCLTANAQMNIDRALQARAVSIAKKQMVAEEAAKYEDLVVVYTENGALKMVVRDGAVEHYSQPKKVEIPEWWHPPYYLPVEKTDPVEEWYKSVLLFAELQEQLEKEKFELHNSFAAKDGEVFVYRRKVSKK